MAEPNVELVHRSTADQIKVACIAFFLGQGHDKVLSLSRQDIVVLTFALHFSVKAEAGRELLDV